MVAGTVRAMLGHLDPTVSSESSCELEAAQEPEVFPDGNLATANAWYSPLAGAGL